jgi:hypothetical protein
MAPIPTKDYVRVWSDLDVLTGETELNIYDASMRLLSTKTITGFGKLNEQISLIEMQQGIYIVQLKDKNNQWIVTRKVVKN